MFSRTVFGEITLLYLHRTDTFCALSFSTIVTDIDNCGTSSPCQNGGTCEDQVAGYTCLCADGYEGDNCDGNVNDCAENPCSNGGTCYDEVNGYRCDCVAGYTGPSCGTGNFLVH